MSRILRLAGGFGLAIAFAGCARNGDAPFEYEKATILDAGSETMVELAQVWAEEYNGENPGILVQVIGGGTGVGIASLTDGTCDLANASREMTAEEAERIVSRQGKEPKEHLVAYDGVAIYVHKENPIDSISVEELAEIYGDQGAIEQWSQVSEEAAGLGRIIVVSRQNSSGTYAYFREEILGKKRDYRLGTIDLNGSKDVVACVSRTAGAIGYSGMGYATPKVKMLRLSKKKGGAGVEPTLENARAGSYPLTRPLYVYTVGEPTGAAKAYLEWILSPEGQKAVREVGCVPIK